MLRRDGSGASTDANIAVRRVSDKPCKLELNKQGTRGIHTYARGMRKRVDIDGRIRKERHDVRNRRCRFAVVTWRFHVIAERNEDIVRTFDEGSAVT